MDLVRAASLEPLRISCFSESRSSESDTIDLTVGDRLLAHVRIVHFACYENRNAYILLDLFCELDIVTFFHICRCYRIVERIIYSGVAVEHVISIRLEQLCDLACFFDGTACLFISEERWLVEAFDP